MIMSMINVLLHEKDPNFNKYELYKLISH